MYSITYRAVNLDRTRPISAPSAEMRTAMSESRFLSDNPQSHHSEWCRLFIRFPFHFAMFVVEWTRVDGWGSGADL